MSMGGEEKRGDEDNMHGEKKRLPVWDEGRALVVEE